MIDTIYVQAIFTKIILESTFYRVIQVSTKGILLVGTTPPFTDRRRCILLETRIHCVQHTSSASGWLHKPSDVLLIEYPS